MKFTDRKDAPIVSEGKLIEVIPFIETAVGQPFMLPPVVWPVPNELMGFKDFHVLGMPYTIHLDSRVQIPGTNSAYSHRLGFLVRIMEASPDSEPRLGSQISADDVRAIIEAIKKEV